MLNEAAPYGMAPHNLSNIMRYTLRAGLYQPQSYEGF
jgi:hypothetical protein